MGTAVDVYLLPTHPHIGRSADHAKPLHVDSHEEALEILANMLNGQHYEIRECRCGDAQ